ncbi:Protein of unknown function D [Prunus dulcis]|uniref:MINDY deubiquitinase domain-containing protein n=1 Tax=Prunus dulcis TaxID=3755 RepID=A0A4Y1RHY9_PRUDU|nr:Protein of unknown function D [Prunus dulcis]
MRGDQTSIRAMASSSTEEQGQEQQQPQPQQQQQQQQPVKECVHKTKLIQFLGRSAPIVLQNDNGNVLSLRNSLNLSPDTTEVSQEKLLSLIAERLIDSNSNIDKINSRTLLMLSIYSQLATGIDVNIKFRRIGDFEFTPECAIFDLLDIPLYHGWIVDPQDDDTANAIGSKSYNALMGELVALETWNMESECKNTPEEDCVDFAAATTATLGVPSPCLSKTRSFDESPHSASDEPKARKGDLEEEAELIMALKMSEGELTTTVGDPLGATTDNAPPSVGSDGSTRPENVMCVDSVDKSEKHTAEYNNIHLSDLSVPEDCNASRNESQLTTDAHGSLDKQNGRNMAEASCLSAPNVGLDSSSGRVQQTDAVDTLTSSGGEPIYEGEERILDSGTTVLQDKEPVYEGEVVLANQADKSPLDARSKGEITPQQEGLKERELCVFFRNNHFSTMFKFNGELYLLATDQGYINQPDLVWEKLNEVNGDTLFMTGHFKEFKVENHANDTWDENNAVTTTADYLASIDSASQAGFDMNSDLQLAIALQQQEFDQQPQRQNSQQPSISGNSRMVTGPQVTRSNPRTPTSSSARPEAKSKEKCTLM